jgi:type IV pilus assembly protein PilA
VIGPRAAKILPSLFFNQLKCINGIASRLTEAQSMKSAKCSQCGFVGWEGADCCKKCGAEMTSPVADGAYQTQQTDNPNQPQNVSDSQPKLKTQLAVASLVVGIVSCFTLGGLLGIGASVGIVLSILALVKASRYPEQYGGKGLATGGLVTSILSIAILMPIGIIAAIAIPNLLAARIAANETSSIIFLKKVSAAEATYQSIKGKYGNLDELASEHLIEPDVTLSEHHGYKFTINGHSEPDSFEAVGVPVSYRSSGMKSFYIDETGVIRAADRRGAEATRLDPPYSGSPYRRGRDEDFYSEENR